MVEVIISVRTNQGQQFIDITSQVRSFVEQEGLQDGFVVVYVPHTTAAVTINENSDPAVERDIIATLNKVFPVHAITPTTRATPMPISRPLYWVRRA